MRFRTIVVAVVALLLASNAAAQTYPGQAQDSTIAASTQALATRRAALNRIMDAMRSVTFAHSSHLKALGRVDTVRILRVDTVRIGTPVVVSPTPIPAPPAGSAPAPTATSVFALDERAKYQNATSLADLLAGNPPSRLTNASHFFEPNVDGFGTNARGINWNAPTGSEQEAFVENWAEASASGWYTSWKMYLGRSPTGQGVGSLGAWALGAHSNPHQKTILWNRDDLDSQGRSPSRIYLAVRPGGTKFSIDGLNYNSPFLSVDPTTMTGMVQAWVVFIQPSTGTIRCWINGALVLDATGQNIGPAGLTKIQQTATTMPAFPMTQYMYDVAVWR